MLNELVVRIGSDIRGAINGLSEVQKKLEETGTAMREFGQDIFAYTTLPMTLAGAAMIKFASSTEEAFAKSKITFGDSAKTVISWSETSIKSMGMAQVSALKTAATFGDMAVSLGITRTDAAKMSMTLVQLGADIASFKDVSIEQAMTALTGIFTGETESLKQLGYVMLESTLQAYALSKGIEKKVEKMTEAEKVALRYRFILEKTRDAQGDFGRNSENAAGQMRQFQENLKELAAKFGQEILPAFTSLLSKINEFLKMLSGAPKEVKQLILVVGGLTAVIAPLSIALGVVLTYIAPVVIAMKSLIARVTIAAAEFRLLTGAAGAFGVGVWAVYEWTKAIKALIYEWDRFGAFFKNTLSQIVNYTRESLAEVSAIVGKVIGKDLKEVDGWLAQQKAIIETNRLQSEYRYQTALVTADIKRLVDAQNKEAGKTDYMTSQAIIRNEVTEQSLKLNAELIAKAKELKAANDELRKSQMESVTKLGTALETSLKKMYLNMEKMDIDRVEKYKKLDIQRAKDDNLRLENEFKEKMRITKQHFDKIDEDQKNRRIQELAGIDSVLGAEIKAQQEKIKAIEAATEAEDLAAADAQRLSDIALKKDLLQNADANKLKAIEAARSAINLEKIELEADKKEQSDKEEANRIRLIQEAQANRELEKARMIHNYNQKLQAADGQQEANKVVADFEYQRLQDQIDFENKIAKINENSKLKQLDIDASYAERVKELDEKLAKEQIQIGESFAKQNEQTNKELTKEEAEHARNLLLRQRKADIAAAQQEIDRVADLAKLARENVENQNAAKEKQNEDERKEQIAALEDEKKTNDEAYTKYLSDLEIFHNNKIEKYRNHYKALNEEEAIQETVRRGLIEKDQNSIIELLKTFDPKWQDAGRSYGEQLIEGLNSKKQSIQSAVNSILSMIPSNLTVPTAPNAKTPKTPTPSTFAEMVSGIKNEYQPVFNLYANDRVLASSAGNGMNDILRSKVNTNR